jgi:hypothetical protein
MLGERCARYRTGFEVLAPRFLLTSGLGSAGRVYLPAGALTSLLTKRRLLLERLLQLARETRKLCFEAKIDFVATQLWA